MASGIIIHVTVGTEKRTELFLEELIRVGSDELSDLQIRTDKIPIEGNWFELERQGSSYSLVKIPEIEEFTLNGEPLRRFAEIKDGDVIRSTKGDISFSFFALNTKASLITTNREQTHVAQFIEEAALDAAASPKRDEAKAFLREFVRELSREISWTTKIIMLVLAVSVFAGLMYLGIAFNNELKRGRKESEAQREELKKLQDTLAQTSGKIDDVDKSNRDIIKSVSLAQNLRVEYGNGVCLIVGVYDLVDRRNGKTLRYYDPLANTPDPYEPAPTTQSEDPSATPPVQQGLTTEGNGSPVEYDFIGTGFHAGNGYIVTNRHVLQPWEEDDMVKQLMTQSNGRARVKRLIAYFPNFSQPFPIKVQQVGSREDLGIAKIDASAFSTDLPILPLETSPDAAAIGKTVVTMGYPNGPDRLLAMVDDSELKSINARFGGSRQAILSFLAQSKKIVPLTTQGAITDLDTRRIVHDAKTAEGGSGAPLFGQTGKVIGVNFGVFTESTAANMAVPIKFAIDLLKRAGWQSPEEAQAAQQTAATNANTATTENKQ
jgi:Trypsin-like peptidase domain